MSNTKATLQDLAKLTMLTGRISETHSKNMEAFPFIFFHGVKEVGLDYSIATNHEETSTVIYKLTIEEDSLNDHKEKRYAALENAIRTLFWKEVKTEIHVNGEEVFKSK